MTLTILLYIVFITWVVMLLRVIIGFVSSDLFIIRQTIARKSKKRTHLPTVTVLIPAYNEENVIVRALASVRASNYPAKKLEVIVINDGSTDNTENVIKAFKKAHKVGCKIRLLNRPNGGKAKALNYALKKSVRTSLVMCLDADSFLHRDALRNAVQYFRDRKVIALSTNVNVVEDGTLIGLAQRIEYLMGFHIKKGITLLGINYIIGGAGSMFRYSMLKRAGYYEGNTLTEDLDVTLKIFRAKRRDEKIAYAHDAITFTEAVHSLRALMRQRYRW
ncbi:MAG TPA: glycosyltransferase family 2 protein, partial [Candidatus Saccharimonadales bacterium]|nr:glycosyltransferase family 2 protein [Candidatus Saccharimonadales bacterium]